VDHGAPFGHEHAMLDPDRKYARVERERRFLLDALPSFVDTTHFERFEDLFVIGTHVRVRTIRRADGTFVISKVGQKIVDPDAPDDPQALAALPTPPWAIRDVTSEPRYRSFSLASGA
jgi:hypothetical protein